MTDAPHRKHVETKHDVVWGVTQSAVNSNVYWSQHPIEKDESMYIYTHETRIAIVYQQKTNTIHY